MPHYDVRFHHALLPNDVKVLVMFRCVKISNNAMKMNHSLFLVLVYVSHPTDRTTTTTTTTTKTATTRSSRYPLRSLYFTAPPPVNYNLTPIISKKNNLLRKMKFSFATSVLAITAGASLLLDSSFTPTSTVEAFAFTPSSRTTTAAAMATTKITTKMLLRMSSSSTEDEVAKLRAAAAKAREEATKLAKELGKDDVDIGGGTSTTTTTATSVMTVEKKSPDEVATAIRSVDFSGDSAASQVETLDGLRKEGYLSLYKSATEEAGSGDLRSYPVTLSMLEQRSGLTAETLGIGVEEVSLDDFKYGKLLLFFQFSVARCL